MKTGLPNYTKWLVFVVLTFAVAVAKAQTVNGLTGHKTANIIQPGGVSSKGNADVSAPMAQQISGSTIQFYYGDTILNFGASNPVTLKASRTVDAGGTITAGGDPYIEFRNAGNASIGAGTTSYIRVGHAPFITGVSSLVGGFLGLSSVYNITGRGYTGATNYITGAGAAENAGNPAGNARTEFLLDKDGIWYAAITPDAAYNAVRLNVAFATSANLMNVSRDIEVAAYNAFFYSGAPGTDCGMPVFTKLAADGTSLNLSSTTLLAKLDTAVAQPDKAIDDDVSTFSRITGGALGTTATTISQTLLFYGAGNSTDVASIMMSLPTSALTAAFLSNVTFTAYNGTTQVGTPLALSLAPLVGQGDHEPFFVDMKPGGAFDRITISLKNLSGISAATLGSGIRIYEAKRVANTPVITVQPTGDTLCAGGTVVFSTTATGTSLSYLWQTFQDNDWVNISSDNPLTITNAADNVSGRYRVLVTGGSCPTWQSTYTSQEAMLKVYPIPITPPIQLEQVNN